MSESNQRPLLFTREDTAEEIVAVIQVFYVEKPSFHNTMLK